MGGGAGPLIPQIELPWTPFLPHQRRFFDFEPSGSHYSVEFLGGGWRSGKTEGVARKAFKIAHQNPWRPDYGEGNPTGVVLSPTFRTLRTATMPAIRKLIPSYLVKRFRGPPHNDLLLSNGHLILFFSGLAELEGVTLCWVWVDEVQHPIFALNPQKFMNIIVRVSDPLSPRLAFLASGLPEAGFVRDQFDRTGPDHNTILCGLRDNHHIPEEVRRKALAQTPSGQGEALLSGSWIAPEHAIYAQYDASVHLVDREGDTRQPVHIGHDVGNFGAMLVAQKVPVEIKGVTGQPTWEEGLLIVDQILTHGASVDEQCYHLRTQTDWLLRPGESTFCVDPTIRREELQAVRKHFPKVRIVKRDRGDEYYPVETGIRAVQRALKDALGNVRLTFCRHLAPTKNGVIGFLESYRRNDKTQAPIKNNMDDHVGDCLRYLCSEHLPAEKPRARVIA